MRREFIFGLLLCMSVGCHVLSPAPGLYRNILVFDFKSLYPSIMRTFLIDPVGYVKAPEPQQDPAALIKAPSDAPAESYNRK